MHDPKLEDHATGLELQIVELVEQAERARVQGRLVDAARLDREIERLQGELAATAERAASPAPNSAQIYADEVAFNTR